MIRLLQPQHVYMLGDTPVQGVTTILKNAGCIDTTYFKDAARERGIAVHRAVEAFLCYGVEDITPALAPYLEGFKRFLNETGFDVLYSEKILYSPTYDYAGTGDLFGVMGGEIWYLDTKTGEDLPAYHLQSAAYAFAFTEETGITVHKRGGLKLSDDGTYRIIPHEDPSDYDDFVAQLRSLRWHMKYTRKNTQETGK